MQASLMALWRVPELEAVLGGLLDETGLTEAALQDVVAAQAREGEQLEFKSRPYPPAPPGTSVTWNAAQEFTKDVAALANLRGGLILIGVKEENEVATAADPCVTDPGALEQRLRQALANHAAPAPRVAFVSVPSAVGGYYVAVVVPPSPAAPHAVVGGSGSSRQPLHYPVRDGADVRWMRETEVADRYRRRLDAGITHAARVRSAMDGGLDALNRASGLWLYVAVVPLAPVPAALDRAAVRDAEKWWRSYSFLSPHGRHLSARGSAIPAPGRVTITAPRYRDDDEEADPRGGYVELHVDGTAFAATPVSINTDDVDGDGTVVGEVTLADDTVLAVDACLSWAVRQSGAWGTADVAIGLIDADIGRLDELGRPVVIAGMRYGELSRLPGTRQVRRSPHATTCADLATSTDVQGRLVVAHDALAALLQHFGVAQPAQLGADGTVITRTWNADPSQIERWAETHGVGSRPLPEP